MENSNSIHPVDILVQEWNCTELEAELALELDTHSLAATRKAIAQAVTEKRRTSQAWFEHKGAEYGGDNLVYGGRRRPDQFRRDPVRVNRDRPASRREHPVPPPVHQDQRPPVF